LRYSEACKSELQRVEEELLQHRAFCLSVQASNPESATAVMSKNSNEHSCGACIIIEHSAEALPTVDSFDSRRGAISRFSIP
jgi:hypothetical protein